MSNTSKPCALPDTSCLIHLERIGRLDLLYALYDEFRIPPAVRDEFGRVPKEVDVVPVENRSLVQELRNTLDAGEAELIALALESKPVHVILDDAAARAKAKEFQLSVLGTVGLLLRAKKSGYIDEVGPILRALRGKGFWISDRLYRRALHEAGEPV